MATISSDLTFDQIRSFVHTLVKEKTCRNMKNFIQSHDQQVTWWAEIKPRSWKNKVFYLGMYKRATGVGYEKLQKLIHSWWHINHKSLQHNTVELFRLSRLWAKKHIHLGDDAEWKAAARNVDIPNCVKEGRLFLDSSDFRREGKRTISKKSDSWSYKEDSPAIRFFALSDAKRRIRRMWGPTSPKYYDGHWLAEKAKFFNDNCEGVGVFADCAFHCAKGDFTKCILFASAPETQAGISSRTKDQNKAIKQIRARVESPFGDMKGYFEELSGPFKEQLSYHEDLIWTAAGIHNFEL